ncbi:MAG: hypothetical protein WD342_04930 [Verrucomicrobiales bacterium]
MKSLLAHLSATAALLALPLPAEDSRDRTSAEGDKTFEGTLRGYDVADAPRVPGGREVFRTPDNGANLGVWRITDEPAIRHWAEYHNTRCWSHDGRYLAYTRNAPDPDSGRFGSGFVEVHVYDAHRNESRLIERGVEPRWARHRNRLFYVRYLSREQSRAQSGATTEVRRLDLDTGESVTLHSGAVEPLGETTFDDEWLIGAERFRGQDPEFVVVRIGTGPQPAVERLSEVTGSQLLPNPRHPVFFTRRDERGEPFGGTRWFYDLDGGNRRMAVPTLQQCHMAWLGNGEYLLLGNGLVRGRRWDRAFPSNVDVLAAVTMGDISPCGRSGRYVCGDSRMADLRSGDGWETIDPLSMICYPAAAGDQSGNFDSDPTGSPDGTKVSFVTNYDLEDGPLTHIDGQQDGRGDTLRVTSTEGFPDSGLLTVRAEVIGYERKGETTFEGLSREVHETSRAPFNDGMPVTSFDARLMTDEQWQSIPGPTSLMRQTMPEGSPLLRQRQTDVHVVVVRKPDRPFLRLEGETAQIIPGEEHFETYGYHLLRGDERLTREPLRPGATLALQPGEYRAVAVEWSGLESDPGLPLRVDGAATLQALPGPPSDFSWTTDHWLAGGRAASEADARQAAEAVREIHHRHDGVIHREWYRRGALEQRHDFNAAGEAVRRLTYEQGRLGRREYFQPDDEQVSLELLDAEGFVTESIRYSDGRETDHWWFERGMPVRQVRGRSEWVKQGEQWVRNQLPRE